MPCCLFLVSGTVIKGTEKRIVTPISKEMLDSIVQTAYCCLYVNCYMQLIREGLICIHFMHNLHISVRCVLYPVINWSFEEGKGYDVTRNATRQCLYKIQSA